MEDIKELLGFNEIGPQKSTNKKSGNRSAEWPQLRRVKHGKSKKPPPKEKELGWDAC